MPPRIQKSNTYAALQSYWVPINREANQGVWGLPQEMSSRLAGRCQGVAVGREPNGWEVSVMRFELNIRVRKIKKKERKINTTDTE
jgi:hypothetical protein